MVSIRLYCKQKQSRCLVLTVKLSKILDAYISLCNTVFSDSKTYYCTSNYGVLLLIYRDCR